MSFYCAAPHVRRKVLILKQNEIIGRGLTENIRNDIIIRISMDDSSKELVVNTQMARIINNWRYVQVPYFRDSGVFLAAKIIRSNECSTPFQDSPAINFNYTRSPESEIYDIFKNTRIVDEYRLGLGLVPDEFKNVPGYASNILQFEKWLLDPEDIFGLNND